MKNTLFLVMGLGAALAFSPQPASSAAPEDSGSNNVYVDNSNSVQAGTYDIAFVAMGDEAINDFSYHQSSGQETVHERSDHSVVNDIMNYTNHLDHFGEKDLNVSNTAAVGRLDHLKLSCSSAIMMSSYNHKASNFGMMTATAAITSVNLVYQVTADLSDELRC